MRAEPASSTGLGTYPFVRLDEAKAAAAARGARIIDFGVGEPREETPPFIRAAPWPRRSRPSRSPATRRRRACRSCGRRSRRGSRAGSARTLDPDDRDRADARAPRRRSSGSPRSSAARARGVAVTTPGYPVPARGALFAGRGGRRAARSTASERLAAGPRRRRLGRRRDPVAELAEQPDRRVAAPLAFYERAAALRARARLRPRLRRGVLRALVRGRPARERAAGRRPHERARLQHALQALVDAGLPLRLRRRRPRARRRAQALPPERRDGAAGVRAARGGRRVGRRGRTSSRPARATRPSATSCCPRCAATGLEPAGGDATFFLWLRVPGDGDAEAFALRAARRPRRRRRPGPFFGPGGEGHVRVALVPTLEECRAGGASF